MTQRGGVSVVGLTLLFLVACGGPPEETKPLDVGVHPLLGVYADVVLDERTGKGPTPASRIDQALRAAMGGTRDGSLDEVIVDYPFEGTIFPPGFVSPTFLWRDESGADTWWVEIRPGDGGPPWQVLVPGGAPRPGEIDERALGATNEIYEPTPEQAAARAWTPTRTLWEDIQARSVEAPASLAFRGFLSTNPSALRSEGSVRLRTSTDPVGAPIFYRDVPLLPAVGEKGKIQPLGPAAIPLIAWRLKDVTRDDSRLLLTDMPSCANCHSFSRDGKTLGMDIDGPEGDKGTYAIAPVTKDMHLGYDDLITWNSFPDKPEGHKTIGFLSRISPDGRYAITTLNEELYVSNFVDHEFLQVFFPTRGILAVYDRETKTMAALPGADDPAFVHCDPVWSPDGSTLVFAREVARDPYESGVPRATRPNDPNEPQVRYDLYRMPFNEGRGGEPTRVVGASENGMSNTFPKVSPDGKWIVYTKCRNGQLLRPDSKLWIVPLAGGEARELACNLPLMNSWHSFSPNGRWLVWSSKSFTPYTQMFLTHLDEEGHASPAVLVPHATAANRAVNLPEFLNAPYDALLSIDVPAVKHRRHFFMGTRRLERGDFAGAIPHLKKALRLEPDFSRAHVNLGFALLKTGQGDEALEHFKRAVAISPRDPFALTNLAGVMLQAGNIEQALHYGERALEADEENPSANQTYGQALVENGEWARALPYFEHALDLQPRFWQAQRSLALVLLRLDRKEEAIRALEAALLLRPGDAASKNALEALRSD